MKLVNEWYCCISAIDKNTCNKILSLAKDNWKETRIDTKTNVTDEERKSGRECVYNPNPERRVSDISWSNEQWVWDLIWPYMLEANENAGWKFDIRAVEDAQITRYKTGGFYKFHKDGFSDHLSTYDYPDNPHMDGFVRKLSMTVLLNDNYEGGDFQFCTYQEEKHEIFTTAANSAGSIIVFPSFLEHRVAPVTKGTRYSLVSWFVGPPFR